MLIVGGPPARMCKASNVSLILTLLEKKGFENRVELFEYRDNFSKLKGKSHNKCSLRKLGEKCIEDCGTAIFILIASDYSNLDW